MTIASKLSRVIQSMMDNQVYCQVVKMKNTLTTFWTTLTDSKSMKELTNRAVWPNLLYALKALVLFGLLLGLYRAQHDIPIFVKQSTHLLEYVSQNIPQDFLLNWDGQNFAIQPKQIVIDKSHDFPFDDSSQFLFVAIEGSFAPADLASNSPGTSLLTLTSDQVIFSYGQEKSPILLADLLPNKSGQLTASEAKMALKATQDGLISSQLMIQILTPVIVILSLIFLGCWLSLTNGLLAFIFVRIFGPNLETRSVVNLVVLLTIPALLLAQLGQLLYPTTSWPLFDLWFWPSFFITARYIDKSQAINTSK